MSRSSTAQRRGSQGLQQRQIASEQNRLLFGTLPMVLSVNMLLALAVALTMARVVGLTPSLGWMAAMSVVQLLRLALYRAYRGRRAPDGASMDAQAWRRRFRVSTLVSGLVWGAGGLLMFPVDAPIYQMFLAMMMAAISAGSMSSLAIDPRSLLAFILPVLLPFGARMAWQGGHLATLVSVTEGIFVVYIMLSSRRLQRQFEENVLLRAEAVSQRAALKDEQRLNEIIARVQRLFIHAPDRSHAFETLLQDMLDLTGSAFGFIAEVRHDAAGVPYLKSRALSDISWSEETRGFYAQHKLDGMEFRGAHTLFGAVLQTGEAVIANDPAHDARSGGLPPGHPPLLSFMGLPVYHGGTLVAEIGLANRPGGYGAAQPDFLLPLLVTLGHLVDAEHKQLQYELHQVELARLSRVASQTTNGVVITDAQRRVEWINDGFTRISGYTLDELRGKVPGAVLQGPETDPAVVERIRAALQREEPVEAELLNYTKSGQPYWIQISCNPLRDAAGQLQGFMAIEQDITLRKADAERLRETTQLLDSIVENVPNMVFLKHAEDLRYAFINRSGERMIGLSREELLGRSNHDIFPAALADSFAASDRRALASAGLIDLPEEHLEMPDGLRIVHSQKLALRDAQGKAQYLLGIVEDITERHRVERMKNEFVSTVSHELRTPLTVITGALGLLADGVLERKPQRAREMVEAAHANAERLTALINDLLDMDKLAAGKMSFDSRREDLAVLVRRAIAENQGYAEQHGASIALLEGGDAPLPVLVDAQRLLQVLANLLSNASKFSPSGATVEVRLRLLPTREVQVEVQDHGPGIPLRFRERIFEKFAQADATNTRLKGGTGLGLAISRELVQGMGGSIGFVSEEGQGACFHVRFALADEAPAATA